MGCDSDAQERQPDSLERLAARLERILGGTASISDGVILIQQLRDLDVKIEGIRTASPLVLPFFVSVEPACEGYWKDDFLNLGETVLLTKEVNPFLSALRECGLTVTALHNHWLFTNPAIWYMHWQNVGSPIEFAERTAWAARVLSC
jgi:hypothetical protein